MSVSWHALDLSDVFKIVHSSNLGLTAATANNRLLSEGPNCLPTQKKKSHWLRFFGQFYSPIILILAIAGIVKVVLGQLSDAIAIFFVVVFNAILGFSQERKAENSLEALRRLSAAKAKVFRDGVLVEIEAEKIVLGDILFLESGTRIAADCRLIETHALDIDESLLTGESSVVRKKADLFLPEDTSIAKQHNMVFAGTIVTRGRARAVVISTGQNTYMSSIVIEAEKATPPPSPLEKRMKKFGHSIAILTLIMMGVITLIGIVQGYSLPDIVMICVSLTVSAVPEGLPIAITIVLSIGLFEMAKRNAIVRKLGTIETLGCTTVICTDKTGTLTKNSMSVGKTYLGLEDGAIWAARIAYFCSETRLESNGFVGDPCEAALMQFARDTKFLDEEGWEKELLLPFESEQQMMACTIRKNGKKFTVWKGSLQALQKKCTMMWLGNTIVPFDLYRMDAACKEMAQEGLKVLCLAYGEGESTELTMAGVLGLIDPPREKVKEAIQSAQEAGIRVVMITGDDPVTAASIGKEIGLHVSFIHPPLTGIDIDHMNDAALYKAVEQTTIFARTTPHHKLRIVQQLQKHGEVVAMTGDGVNDAPPLRQADIGIAMGDGTDVAKEASAMVIVDNDFASIVEAVRRGRVMFKSLQQMIVYLLTTCFGGIMTISAAILLGAPLPVLPLQLLWINLVTDGSTTIPLSLEGEHGDVMKAQPRKQHSSFISHLMFGRSFLASSVMMIGTLCIFIWALNFHNVSLDYARTMSFTSLALFQIFNALNSRSVRRSLFFNYSSSTKDRLERIPFFQNWWLLFILASCIVLQILAVEFPLLQEALHTTSLSWSDWMKIAGISLSIIVVVEIHKAAGYFFTQPARP
jgi:calcium-translocating P-type ATPase